MALRIELASACFGIEQGYSYNTIVWDPEQTTAARITESPRVLQKHPSFSSLPAPSTPATPTAPSPYHCRSESATALPKPVAD